LINRILLFALVFFELAIGTANSQGSKIPSRPQVGGFDVILLMGQSNATSRGLIDAPTERTSNTGIWQLGRYRHDYEIVPAAEPLMNVTYASQGIGFTLPFARYYRDHFLSKGRAVLIVPAAKGATSVARSGAYWRPGRAGDKDVRARMNAIWRDYPNARLAAILWHQGESDLLSDQYTYRGRTAALLTSIRDQFDPTGKAPIILGELADSVRETATAEPVSASIRYLAHTIPNAGLALAAGLPTHGEVSPAFTDLTHFSAKSQLELAKRYICTYARLARPDSQVARLPYCERFTSVPVLGG
jgi:hypothetical protein